MYGLSEYSDHWYQLQDDGRSPGCTDVTGSLEEWVQIAEAIKRGESCGFRRCAASRDGVGWYRLSCPRNAYDRNDCALLTPDEAIAFADSVLSLFGHGAGI